MVVECEPGPQRPLYGQPRRKLVAHVARRYTTTAILNAEDTLVAAANEQVQGSLSKKSAQSWLRTYPDIAGLDPSQAELAVAFTESGRHLTAGIGPAGSGKTTAMRAACHVWDATRTRVVPLATSSASAAVLSGELGRRAENLHKFLHELGQPRPRDPGFYRLGKGDVVLLDEAGMAGTLRLVQLLAHARAALRAGPSCRHPYRCLRGGRESPSSCGPAGRVSPIARGEGTADRRAGHGPPNSRR